MKTYIIFLFTFFILSIQISLAQVGVGTSPEEGSIFHVKGKTSDLIIDSVTGRVGIGVDLKDLQEKLEVKGNTTINGIVNIDGNIILNNKGLIKDSLTNVADPSHRPNAVLEIIQPDNSKPGIIIEDTDFSKDKYLMSDMNGNAMWQSLRAPFEIVGFDDATKTPKPLYILPATGNLVVTGTPYSSTADEFLDISRYTDITHNPLILSKGKWLILAQYTTRASIDNQSPGMIYTSLVSKPVNGNSDYKKETVFGVQPEQNGWSIGTPQLFTIVTVKEETEFRIRSLSMLRSVRLLDVSASSPGSFFCAVKLSEE